MPDKEMGDEVYQPVTPDAQAQPEDLDPDNSIDDKGLDETLDEGYSPPEKPLAVNRHGTTASEQRAGESLDDRLHQEQPEVEPPEGNGIGDQPGMAGEPVDPEAGEKRAGRLVALDEGVPRRTNDVQGTDVGIDGGAAGAEEAAVHIIDDRYIEDEDMGGTEESANLEDTDRGAAPPSLPEDE